jgi:hypothetical protein
VVEVSIVEATRGVSELESEVARSEEPGQAGQNDNAVLSAYVTLE